MPAACNLMAYLSEAPRVVFDRPGCFTEAGHQVAHSRHGLLDMLSMQLHHQ